MSTSVSPSRVVIAGLVCLTILGGSIVGHAWPLWTGRSVIMSVIPVDPRDPFRGEYVRLRTPANSLRVGTPGANAVAGRTVVVQPLGSGLGEPRPGTVVYVQLEPTAAGEHLPVTISASRVPNALNLRGRVRYAPSPDHLEVDYGLDAFYVQEGTGRIVEEALRQGKKVRMEVALASSGKSRIRSLTVDGIRVGR
jgi:GDYXXLXY protein